MNRTQEVVDRILAGEVLAAARLMRELDDGRPEAREILKELYRHSGRAHIIGITGQNAVHHLLGSIHYASNPGQLSSLEPSRPSPDHEFKVQGSVSYNT